MLKAITKKYSDESDLKKFRFTFYCDCCGKAIQSPVMEYQNGFQKKAFLTNDEREARAIIYADAHQAAYERANNEIRMEMNRCEICGDMVCDDCSVYPEALHGGVCCRGCAAKLKQEEKSMIGKREDM